MYNAARSNYFRVKDPAKFRADMTLLSIQVWSEHSRPADQDNEQTKFAIAPIDGEWPSMDYRQPEDNQDDIWFPEALADYLADGEIAVLVSSGHDKLRSIYGFAVAMRSDGEYVDVSLAEIYTRAKEKFGIDPSVAEY